MPPACSPPPSYACLYQPPTTGSPAGPGVLGALARDFSPRFELHHDGLVSIDVGGLERLIGPARTIGEELRRAAAARGVHPHVAIARTRSVALLLALARPGLTVVDPGQERDAVAPLPIEILEKAEPLPISLEPLKQWGIRTLGELAALPPAALAARLGRPALGWRALARGEDTTPLVPALPEERFESTLELEWPVEGLEPLSFVLTRLLEPLSARLERRDRGAAVLHLGLRLVTREAHVRHLQLPSPIRDARTLRTLLLLDLESHPPPGFPGAAAAPGDPPAAVDRVSIVIDPTPGRIVQHTLFARAHPTPEQLSTLLARLGALMGAGRVAAPAPVDSYRPGGFAMAPFATDHDERRGTGVAGPRAASCPMPASALRRCRQPVPARAVVEGGRPARLTTDRRGFAGGTVVAWAGPWRTSGDWWKADGSRTSASDGNWDRDEWDVALADGAVYRVFRDCGTNRWFVDAIVD